MTQAAIQAIMIGAGQRGTEAYGPYALSHPEELQFVAVAEPNTERRTRFAAQHSIPLDRQFESWEALLALPSVGQAAFICTPDWLHTRPAMRAMEAGYHVLLEKPMAAREDDCRALVQMSQQTGQQLHICHVLRYTRHFQALREVIQSGELGQIIHIDHKENVSFYHMAHSFVRGNWRDSQETSPMILAKCCHDLDILPWLLNAQPEQLQSQGSLTHFKFENAPPGAPRRCLDGCPAQDECPYYAPFIYLDMLPIWRGVAAHGKGLARWATRLQISNPGLLSFLARIFPRLRQVSQYRGWPRSVVAHDPTPANLLTALQTGPYGRCVYHCDNDVVDHQVVLMTFSGGITVTMTMHGHSHLEGRTTRIQGSRGEIQAFFGTGGSWIDVANHRSGVTRRIDTRPPITDGHGGGDHALVAAFLAELRSGGHSSSPAEEALLSHLLAFEAERSRLNTNKQVPVRAIT